MTIPDEQLRCDVIFRKQNERCFYCRLPMDDHPHTRRRHPKGYTTDHFFPKSLGFTAKTGGKVLAHHDCNVRKGDRLPTVCEIERFRKLFGYVPEMGLWYMRQMGDGRESVGALRWRAASQPAVS